MTVYPTCRADCPPGGHLDGEFCRLDYGTTAMAAKWDRWEDTHNAGKRTDDMTFEERQEAIAAAAADTPEARAKHLVDLLVTSNGLDAIPEPDPLVDGVLYLDSLAYLIGPSGNGKSFVALDIAGCVGSGESWQGYPAKRGKVLYMAAEGVSGIKQRVRAWEASMGCSMAGVAFLPMAVQIDDAAGWRALVALCVDMKPALIVLDTQARITLGLEENSAKDMGHVVARLDQLRRLTGACVLCVHHQGRSGEHMRGSSALDAGTNTVIRVTKDEEILTIRCGKQKDAEEFDEFRLRMVSTGQSVVLMPSDGRPSRRGGYPKWVRDWWETHEREPVSVSVLIKSGVVTETTFHRGKLSLLREGVIVRDGKGNNTRYRLATDPTAGDSHTPTLKGGGSGRESSHPLPWDSHGSVGATTNVDTSPPSDVSGPNGWADDLYDKER